MGALIGPSASWRGFAASAALVDSVSASWLAVVVVFLWMQDSGLACRLVCVVVFSRWGL